MFCFRYHNWMNPLITGTYQMMLMVVVVAFALTDEMFRHWHNLERTIFLLAGISEHADGEWPRGLWPDVVVAATMPRRDLCNAYLAPTPSRRSPSADPIPS